MRPFLILSLVLAVACSDSAGPTDSTPPSPVQGLTATVTSGAVKLAWSRPADADVSGSLIARFTSKGVDGAPVAQHVYAVGDSLGSGKVVFVGNTVEFTDTPLCKEQVYGAWARDKSGNWSEQAGSVMVTGLPGSAAPAAPTAVTATLENNQVKLAWTLTGAPAGTTVRVIRQSGVAPAGPSFGEPIFIGTGTSAVDFTLEQITGLTWYYGVYACNPCGDCESQGKSVSLTTTATVHPAPPSGLLQQLRAGSYVIYFRHATANVCSDRTDLGPASSPQIADWWKSCDRDCTTALARQLGAAGYADADKIGVDIKAKAIPFGAVLASEYCRTRQTAERMALGPIIQTIKDVTAFVYPEIDPCPAAEALFAKVPAAGSNTAIVGHLSPQCMSLDMGQAMILKPDGKGGFAMVAKVLPSEWAGLN
jgi:hypothetical protein